MSDYEIQAQSKAKDAENMALQILGQPHPVITTQEQYEQAGQILVSLKSRIKALETERTCITGPINNGLTRINALFSGAKARLEDAAQAVEIPMKARVRELDRIRIAEELEAKRIRDAQEAEARERAAAEQQRLAEIREAQAAAADIEDDENDPLAAILAEQDAAELVRQEQDAVTATADALREAATVAQAPLKTYTPKPLAAGTSIRRPWKFRIVDASKIRTELMLPNEVAIGALVRALKENFNEPGIEAYQDLTIGA